MKKKVLVAGFGLMGCRHVQALLSEKDNFEIHVLEPSLENIKINTERIGAKENDCIWHKDISSIPDIDIAIVATSSGPRYKIVKELLEKGVKYFLLEKIVFQSKKQFDEIIDLMKIKNAKAWCNFVNRYFDAYNRIKSELKDTSKNIDMIVYGGSWGLGCNSVHYIDIFQYITNDNKITISNSNLNALDIVNRRGAEYREFIGTISGKNSKGDSFTLISDKDFKGGTSITIKADNKTYVLNEETQNGFIISNSEVIKNEFTIIPTSRLTHTIVHDIFSDSCKLTQLQDTYNVHISLFNQFNKALNIKQDDDALCPIT